MVEPLTLLNLQCKSPSLACKYQTGVELVDIGRAKYTSLQLCSIICHGKKGFTLQVPRCGLTSYGQKPIGQKTFD
jgi:hypothetical protein